MATLHAVTKYLSKICLYHRQVVVYYWKNYSGNVRNQKCKVVLACVRVNLPKEVCVVFLGGSTVWCILFCRV